MANIANRANSSHERPSIALALRLRKRLPEIEAAILTRIQAVAPIDRHGDPEYLHGLHAAILAAIEYTIATIEGGERRPPPIPLALLGQARLAARHGVTLGTVLRRYNVGSNLISDYIISEAERDHYLQRGPLRQLLREQGVLLERVLGELEHEYSRELPTLPQSQDARLADLIRRQLRGEPVDVSELNYDFDAYHVGVVSEGKDAVPLLRDLARSAGGRLLPVRPGDPTIWAWIGTRHRLDPAELLAFARAEGSICVLMAFGEPGEGRLGWAQTHRQALEALPFARRDRHLIARYADVAVLAAIERYELASGSLRDIYLGPLEAQPDGGALLLATLRAYFAAERNAATAAAILGVTRQTVSKRLKSVEALLMRPLHSCCTDLEIALRIPDRKMMQRSVE